MEPVPLLGRYRLVQRIGEGGMGVVHLALDPQGRKVAVKVLRPHVAADPHARQRLAREVSSLLRVRHPRVAEVLDADTDAELPYVVTQYVPAPPLDDHLRLGGPLAGLALARLGDGLGEALAAIHAAGVVHRDLKPGNVLMLDGDPVVIDFGIAHVADDVRLTSTGLVMGTPGYLSPEVLAGDPVGQATDWWGWAATMAFAATGRPPFGGGPMEVVLDRVRRAEFDLDGVPAALRPVLARALAVDPALRPAPAELRLAVAGLRAGRGDGAAPVGWADDSLTQVIVRPPVVRPVAPPVRRPVRPPVARTTAMVTPATRMLPEPPPYEPMPYEPGPYEDERFDVEPYEDEPYDDEPYDDPGHRPPRSGVMLAALVAFCAVAAVVPVMTVLAGAAWMVLARTVDRASGSLLRRRYERGPRRGDVALMTLASPWHLVTATLASVGALVLPLLVGVSGAFIAGMLLDSASPQPAGTVALAAGALAAALTAWWGPGGSSLRRGSRSVVRALTPGRRGPVVVVGLLLLLAAAAALAVWQTGGAVDWTPLQSRPF